MLMLNFPPELLDLIFHHLDNRDLQALTQASQALRQLALMPFLSRSCNISSAYSGTASVHEEAYYLIPTIHSIHPIQQLQLSSRYLSLKGLPAILASMPPIPDVIIRGLTGYIGMSGVPALIEVLSRGGSDPVVFAGHGQVGVSLPRGPEPLSRWKRLYRRIFGPHCTWDQVTRIATDLFWMNGDSMRIQAVSVTDGAPFTLVTLSGLKMSGICIPRLPELCPAQYSALLAALDLSNHLGTLTIGPECALNLPELSKFIHRHHSLHILHLGPGSISPTSLVEEEPVPHSFPGRITFLTAPAAYIPHMLPSQRCIVDLVITCITDAPQLARALAAIASLDSPRLLALTLYFQQPALPPWRTECDVDIKMVPYTIVRLIMVVDFEFSPEDLHALPRWLARFPSLAHLELRGMVVISPAEEEALEEAIAAERLRTDLRVVGYGDFSISSSSAYAKQSSVVTKKTKPGRLDPRFVVTNY
ncbi:hypothetical protein B0H19DRAFT_1240949 [Mycena capillaripes]|nr:hypothetical protein B0H19DRAFT_1240949 [Mycena capillaripes]